MHIHNTVQNGNGYASMSCMRETTRRARCSAFSKVTTCGEDLRSRLSEVEAECKQSPASWMGNGICVKGYSPGDTKKRNS